MEIERHESFTITLSTTEAWDFWQEVQQLNELRDSGDIGHVLTGNLRTIRAIADTFTLRQYLMPSPGAVPVPPPLSEQERHDRLRATEGEH